METHDLRIVKDVAAVLNISAVADEHQVAPSTISKTVKSVEKFFGIQVFERTTRSFKLTNEGKLLEPLIRAVDAATEQLNATVDSINHCVRGHLKVSVPRRIGRVDFGACISSFLCEYPDIDMHIDYSSREVNLAEEGYDLVIRTGELSDCTLKTKRLTDDPQVIAAAPRYIERHGEPLIPNDLKRHSCLVLGSQFHWKLRRGSKMFNVRVKCRVRCNDASQLVGFALDGNGIVRTSRAMVEDLLAKGQLVALLQDYDASTDVAVRAVYQNTQFVPPRLREFIDFVDKWLRKRNAPSGPVSLSARATNSSMRTVVKKNRGRRNNHCAKRPRAA